MLRTRALAWLILGSLILGTALAACGSRSPLNIDDAGPLDAGPPLTPDAGPPADVCVELPYNEPPEQLRTDFLAQILSADIYFLIDVTGSMEDEINTIRDSLRTQIVPGLAAAIPDVRFSVGRFADFDVPGLSYGASGDEVFQLVQASTPSADQTLAALNRVGLQSGGDTPESLIEALYLSAAGEGYDGFVSPPSCPPGTRGYPCFREDGAPIFLVFTDAPSHNGPGSSARYTPGSITPEPHTYEDATEALNRLGAKVLGLNSGDFGETGRRDLEALARDTGAVRRDGSPIVFDIGRTGENLSVSVVEAVRTLVEDVPIDVSVALEDVETDAVDATMFVQRVIAESATPGDGAVIVGDRFNEVRPGTRVEFLFVLQNLRLVQTAEDQRFPMRIVLLGDGVSRLRELRVDIVVPRIGGGRVCDP